MPKLIQTIVDELNIPSCYVESHGRYKAKISPAFLDDPSFKNKSKGKLVLVTAMNPTPAGEGKTTTSIALAMGLRQRKKNAVLALREPSLGPVFGVKGGGTGGGKATLEPAADINLHFTGDIHAITSAHNLLAAMVDNSVYYNQTATNKGLLDGRRITWGRALDMNDRFLRQCIVGLGGKSNGVPRETYFDITAASEIMAIVAMSRNLQDLERRLSKIVVGQTANGDLLTAEDIGGVAALVALLKDALSPNLVQSVEGGPAFVHCGPFANIAHGCNSILATQMAMATGDYAVTEAGFGFDLGGEKFLNIKCREAGFWPHCVVIVATLRSLRMNGGVSVADCANPNSHALSRGLSNLGRHLSIANHFGLSAVVSINSFPNDPVDELKMVQEFGASHSVPVVSCHGFAEGGEGSTDLADAVVDRCKDNHLRPKFTYDLSLPVEEKIKLIAQKIYGARDVIFTAQASADIRRWRASGIDSLPICMAKTQYSFTDDPHVLGAPYDFIVTVRKVKLSAGAGFAVALTGDVMTMPGLPKVPSANHVRLGEDGTIHGLMQND